MMDKRMVTVNERRRREGMTFTKICMGCGLAYQHEDVQPLLRQEYAEMALQCGHHKYHPNWKRVSRVTGLPVQRRVD
mgnify:CR=1 FL=1